MSYSDDDLALIWGKGAAIQGVDPNKFRKDTCGAWIDYEQYGKRTSLGWNVDHIIPESKGGSTTLSNLRPLQWENNLEKSDDSLKCCITADGDKNVRVC